MKLTLKSVLAVLAGFAAATATWFLLWPAVNWTFSKYFSFEESAGGDTMLTASFYLWILIPCLVGGFVTGLLAPPREMHHLLALTLLSLAVMTIVFWDFARNIEPRETLIILMVPLGVFSAGSFAINWRKKKKKDPETPTI
jgi:hypothetical protein